MHVTELYYLSAKERTAFCEKMIGGASALKNTFHPHQMNYALFGNADVHMHWHLIPRCKTHLLWEDNLYGFSRTRKKKGQRIEILLDDTKDEGTAGKKMKALLGGAESREIRG